MRAGMAAVSRLSRVPRTSPVVLNRTGSHLYRNFQPLHVRNGLRRGEIGIRYASTASGARSESPSLLGRLRTIFWSTSVVLSVAFLYEAFTDTRFSLHRWLVVPTLRFVYPDAEDAHHVGNQALKSLREFGLNPREKGDLDASGDLQVEVLGHTLWNPVGTSAGLDKNAEIPDALLDLGSAYVEVGGITPRPQDGNPKPRVFRLVSQNGIINRYGLNSEGADHVAMRLRERARRFAHAAGFGADETALQRVLDGEAGVPPGSLKEGKLMGVQIAKNKNTPDDVDAIEKDYVYCVEKLAKYADVIVVNVSSPNTENLRDLQRQEPLTRILKGVVGAAQRTERKSKPAVMVKVSPDEDSQEQIEGVCQAIWESGVDGVIVGNTTTRRPPDLPINNPLALKERELIFEKGGYSGPQLFEQTAKLVKRYRQTLDQTPQTQDHTAADPDENLVQQVSSDLKQPTRKVVFCSGGITNGQQALEALNAGADMVQVYTALVYGGAGTISRIKDEMRTELGNKKGKA